LSFDAFIGIPYVDRGRDVAGCDCYGLLRLVYAARGIDLPSHDDRYATAADAAAMDRLIAGELDDWREVERGTERALDGVLIREGRYVRHIGVVTSPGKVLHVQPGGTSRIEPYRVGLLAQRVVGFYRHRHDMDHYA
jgi:cell wall-associated NlpC family hydrolase